MTQTAEQVVREAMSWRGVPYHHTGRSRAGVDCVGLLWVVGEALGLRMHDFRAYDPSPNPAVLLREIGIGMDEVRDRSQIVPGHALMFRVSAHGPPQHFGVLVSKTTMVHAMSSVHKVVEVSIGRLWSRLMCGAWSFRGVTY